MEWLLWVLGIVGGYAGVGVTTAFVSARLLFNEDLDKEMEEGWREIETHKHTAARWSEDGAKGEWISDKEEWARRINRQRHLSRKDWELAWLKEREREAGKYAVRSGYAWPVFIPYMTFMYSLDGIKNADKGLTGCVGRYASRPVLRSREEQRELEEAMAYLKQQKAEEKARVQREKDDFEKQLKGVK